MSPRAAVRAAAGVPVIAAVLLGLGACTALPLPLLVPSPAATPSPLARAAGVPATGDEAALPSTWRSTVTAAPTGPGILAVGTLGPQGSLSATLATAPWGDQVAFGPATYRFRGFSVVQGGTRNGVVVPGGVTGIRGSGTGRTVFEMVPRTSTSAGTIPTAFPRTNQLSLMNASAPGVRLTGFTLRATPQGHLYNGIRIHDTSGVRMSDVRVLGIPGSADSPPGETFGVNDFRTSGSVYRRVEVDGAGVGGAGFGANASDDVTLEDCYLHDDRHSMGATFWQVHDVTIVDTISAHNGGAGFNFERVSGAVRMVRPVTDGNGWTAIRIASDTGSARFTIVDPVYDGPYLTIALPKSYFGRPNLQRRSDIRVLVHGVDRTAEVVRFVRR